jgi:hypothetical protein
MVDPINEAPIESIEVLDGPPENIAEATETVVDGTPTEDTPEVEQPDETTEEQPAEDPESEDIPSEEAVQDDSAGTEEPESSYETPDASPANEQPPGEPELNPGDYLSNATEGYIRNEADLQYIIQDYKKLKETPPEPKFASETAKKVFEYANKFTGKEMEGAQEAFRILGLNIDRLSDKEKIYESMLLDESNKALNPQEFRDWYEEYYEQKFGDAKDDKMMGYDLKREAAKADKSLRETQQSLIPNESKTAEENEQLQRERDKIVAGVERVTGSFKGLAIPVDENPDNDYRFEVSDSDQIKQVRDFMLNPGQWIQDKFNSYYNEHTGQIDYDGLNTWAAQMIFQDQIRESMYRHGQNIKQIKTVKEHKNPSKPVEGKPTVPSQNKSNEDMAWDHLVKQGILPGGDL